MEIKKLTLAQIIRFAEIMGISPESLVVREFFGTVAVDWKDERGVRIFTAQMVFDTIH